MMYAHHNFNCNSSVNCNKLTLSDSAQEGTGQGNVGSPTTVFNGRLKRINTESMIRMIRCGGFASLRTVDI